MLNIEVKNGTNELQYRYVRASIGVSLCFCLFFLFGGASPGKKSQWVGFDSKVFSKYYDDIAQSLLEALDFKFIEYFLVGNITTSQDNRKCPFLH